MSNRKSISITAFLFLGALILALIQFYPLYKDLGIWFGVGLFFFILTSINLIESVAKQVALTHIMLLNQFFQIFIAAIFLYYFPSRWIYRIDNYPVYLSYVVPACIALYFGITFATRGAISTAFAIDNVKNMRPPWANYAKHFYWIGLFFYMILLSGFRVNSLNFITVLLSNLRYVGFFILILSGNKRWWLYGLAILTLDLAFSIYSGMFHDFILWSSVTVATVAYRYHWKPKVMLITLIASVFLLIALQDIKDEYRQEAWYNEEMSLGAKSSFFGKLFFANILDGNLFYPYAMSHSFERFNLGWILYKVIEQVPAIVPHTHGSVIASGLYTALIPRLFDPNKPVAGGRDICEKYTGLKLNEGTSMNIGVIGAMYVDWGIVGGIVGMGIYGLLIGQLFMKLHKKAAENPVWWAWGPFVGLWAIKAEEGFLEVTTWIFKSLVAMTIIIMLAGNTAKKEVEI